MAVNVYIWCVEAIFVSFWLVCVDLIETRCYFWSSTTQAIVVLMYHFTGVKVLRWDLQGLGLASVDFIGITVFFSCVLSVTFGFVGFSLIDNGCFPQTIINPNICKKPCLYFLFSHSSLFVFSDDCVHIYC